MVRKPFLIGLSVFVALWLANFLLSQYFSGQFQHRFERSVALMEGVNKSQPVIASVRHFFNDTGRFPASNQELGIGGGKYFQGPNLESLVIGDGGAIILNYKEGVGDHVRIILRPRQNWAGTRVSLEWDCFAYGVQKSDVRGLSQNGCSLLKEKEPLPALVENIATNPGIDDLIKAIYSSRSALVKNLLSSGINVNAANINGETPLAAAIERGTYSIVNILVKAGADVNATLPHRNNMTMLMFATETSNYRINIIRTLLDHGAKINARDKKGQTSLMYAAKANEGNVIRMLLEAGADTELEDNSGNKAINYAAVRGYNSSAYQQLSVNELRKKEFVYRLPEQDVE